MGGAYVSPAAVFLVNFCFGLYILAVLLRFLFQIVRADFYNPLSQAIVTITNPPLRFIRRYVPALGKLDSASLLLLLILQAVNTWLVLLIVGRGGAVGGVLVIALAELAQKTIYVFMFAIFIQIVIGWISPGTYNPITTLLDDLTHPLLAPARRMVPPVGGLDFSPLIPIVGLNLLIFLLVAPIRDLGYALL